MDDGKNKEANWIQGLQSWAEVRGLCQEGSDSKKSQNSPSGSPVAWGNKLSFVWSSFKIGTILLLKAKQFSKTASVVASLEGSLCWCSFEIRE